MTSLSTCDDDDLIVSMRAVGASLTTIILSLFVDNVNLAQNALTGPIPDLSTLNDLRNLLLYHNKFTGTLPTTLFNLQNLGKTDLKNLK